MRRTIARPLLAVLFATVTVAFIVSPPAEGQSAASNIRARVDATAGAADVKAFIASRIQKGFTPPKTPWGHPDISGDFDTSPEANTPMERPDEWAGRTMDSITPKEMIDAITKRQRAAVESAPFAGGGEPESGIAIAVPIHWFDNLAAVNSRPWYLIDPPDGKTPALSPTALSRRAEAAKAQAEARKRPDFRPGGTRDAYTERNAGERCITMFGGIFRTPGIYGNAHRIVQTPTHVVFQSEMIHESRIVPLDDRLRPSSAARVHFGISRGYWEGNSLVIETTNFHPDSPVYGAFGDNLRVIERFTRIAPDKVEWTVTLDDPATWTRPWTYSYPMTVNDEKPIFEYACHEGNFGMANLLTAGRLADKQGGFGVKK